MMGTPSGVNLTELRMLFLGLRGADTGEMSAGCEGAARVGDGSGAAAAGATGAGAGGGDSTAAAEEEAERAGAVEPSKSQVASASKATTAAAAATTRPRRRNGRTPAASGATEAGVARVEITCQGSG